MKALGRERGSIDVHHWSNPRSGYQKGISPQSTIQSQKVNNVLFYLMIGTRVARVKHIHIEGDHRH